MFDRYRPSEPITVYADDGQTEIGKFAPLRHKPLKFEQIPPLMRNAILAAEDPHFYGSSGLDPVRVIRAGIQSLAAGDNDGRNLSLTQQLARKLSHQQGLAGRVQKWLLGIQFERFYTKEQIIESYANHAWLGENVYGFEAGAGAYFNKPVRSLAPEEVALLAGVPKSPKQYSPLLNVEAAKVRRNQVLDLMGQHDLLSQQEVSDAKATAVQLAPTSAYSPHDWQFDYPLEAVRQYLETEYGPQGGLKVYTTINVRAQTRAVEEIRDTLQRHDRERGAWRSAHDNIGATAGALTKQQLDNYQHPQWYREDYQPGSYVMGLITRVDQDLNQATAKFGSYTAIVTAKDMGMSGRQPKDEFKIGDLVEFKIREKVTVSHQLSVELSQVPATTGALVTLNAKNGEVIAFVGGYDFNVDPLNQATAEHETGSTYKPFIYAAAVEEWGMTANSIISGAPTKRGDWTPHNHDGSPGHKDVPLSVAVAQDYNIAAVHTLDMIGIQTAAQMGRRFGITVPMAPYLSSALGDTPVSLEEMVSAYSAFANKGERVAPHLIRRVLDRNGRTLEEWEQTSYKVTSNYVALTMSDVMRAAAEKGAAGGTLEELGRPVAGSVGVTGDGVDRWFIGYTPTYVTGVWVDNSTPGSRPALSTFASFMKYFLADKPVETFDKPPKMPEDIRELFLQRQREQAEERALLYASTRGARTDAENRALPAIAIEPKLEQLTLPPASGEDLTSPTPATPPSGKIRTGKKGSNDNQ